ncbi:MAG: heme-copper oxidase subunit III [Sumerlaeia bacterium]
MNASNSAELAHADAHDHDHDQVEFLAALNPPPSYWPLLLSLTLGLIPTGTLLVLYGASTFVVNAGYVLAALGVVLSIIPSMGWCHSVIVDKWAGHFGVAAQGRDLILGTKLFFISEIAIFASIFAYYFVQIYKFTQAGTWPLVGTPAEVHIILPAVGLLILLTSSITCEFAHKYMSMGKRGLCKDFMLITIGLGLFFLAIQGYEWGILIQYGFTPNTNNFGTVFYILTGFHGFHVMTGLMMLMLVYGRLELGHYHQNRHFSLQAASWYWHLVDVVWIFVFVGVYCLWNV